MLVVLLFNALYIKVYRKQKQREIISKATAELDLTSKFNLSVLIINCIHQI